MPKIRYVAKPFTEAHLEVIGKANEIIQTYQSQGYKLTLRQLYYQFVARDLIPNKMNEYKRLGSIVNDARLAGMIDWDAIEDRTRNLQSLGHWDSPSSIMDSCAYSYRTDLWATQPNRVEVWIEKEALAGVFQRACEALDVPYLSCRGYTSQSEMWGAAMRLKRYTEGRRTPGAMGQSVVILHFGDHDPSGIDMSRDIVDRMAIFGCPVEFHRLALNMDQVEQYSPPPNPAKQTDSRFASYIERYGNESWELDALEPAVLSKLVTDKVWEYIDVKKWTAAEAKMASHKRLLKTASERWDEVVEFLEGE